MDVYDFGVDYDAIAIADMLGKLQVFNEKEYYKMMFRFIGTIFFTAMMFFSCSALKCVSMNNQEYKIRPEIININSSESLFYLYSILVNKRIGNCNNINDPYAKLCVPDEVKNMNIKVFKLMSRTNETRYTKWHETCKCKCRLDASVCKDKQCWTNDTCRF